MAMYYNGKKVRNLYYNGKCITRLALGKEMTRLVEGDDFVRAEWLVGDGTAYIDTTHNTNEDLDWETKVDNIRDNTFLFWFRTIQGMGDESMIVRTTPSRFRYANNSNEFEDNLTSQPINVETFGTTIFINGIGHSITKYYPRPSILFRLFYAEVDAASQATVDTDYTTNNVKCAYFALRNGNAYVMYLTPCRLLRPIPATLDGNGIARNAGECGMLDTVSGKFYGNVNSVGTFTVENYYERKEWLQGRNGAYINTNHKLVTIEDRFECSIKYDGNSVNPDNREQWIFGVWNNNDVIGNYIARADNKLGVLYKVDNQLWCRCTENYIHKFETFVNGSSFYCIDNGLQFSDSTNGLTEKTINSPCYLYACNGLDATQYFHGDIAYFKITDASSNTKMNLIPCKLLKPVPKWLDANGIRRQVGECGMIDLVSGKFYGNVATSGNFTVSDN